MDPTHVHLMLTHVPVVASIIGTLILIWAVVRKRSELKNVALVIFVGAALIAIPVYLTGEPAEERVEKMTDVPHEVIHDHEEAAELTFIGAEILGAVSLLLLVMGRGGRSVPPALSAAPLLIGLVVSGMFVWTANLGGQVRHSEIRSDTVIPEGGSGGSGGSGSGSGGHVEEAGGSGGSGSSHVEESGASGGAHVEESGSSGGSGGHVEGSGASGGSGAVGGSGGS